MNELLLALRNAFGGPREGGVNLANPMAPLVGLPQGPTAPSAPPRDSMPAAPAITPATGPAPLASAVADPNAGDRPSLARGIFGSLLGIPKNADEETAGTMMSRGIMAMATHLLQAGGRSPMQRGTLANIGSAIEAGPPAAMQGLEDLDTLIGRDRANQARTIMQGLGSDTSPQALRQMFLQLVRSGNTDGAKLMAEVIKISDAHHANLVHTMGSLTPGGPKQELVFDPTDPTARPIPVGIFGAEPTDRPQAQNLVHNGSPELAYVDPQDPTHPVWTGQHKPEAETQIMFRQANMGYAVNEAETALGGDPQRPTAADAAIQAFAKGGAQGFRQFMSSNAQKIEIAQRAYGEADLIRSGARTFQPENIMAAGRKYVPQAGDTPEVLRTKQQLRMNLHEFSRTRGANAQMMLRSLGPMGMQGGMEYP